MILDKPTRWYHGLTAKQRRFVEEYPSDFNASAAARRAGYAARSAGQTGYELLRHEKVRKAIELRMDELAMPKEEALYRLSRIARATMADVITIQDDGTWKLDLKKAAENGAIDLIQEISYDRQGRPKVKLYSAHEGSRDIAKIRGLFVDRVAGEDGGPLKIEIVRE